MGRNGIVATNDADDQPAEIKMCHPRSMGGRGLGHNPEQLFAAAYAASFASALQHVASLQGKVDAVRDVKTHAAVVLGHPSDRKGFAIEVDLTVEGCQDDELIAAAHEVRHIPIRAVVRKLIHANHKGCAYSRLLRRSGHVRIMKNADDE